MERLTGMRIGPEADAPRICARIVLRSGQALSSAAGASPASGGRSVADLIEELSRLSDRTIGSPHIWVKGMAVNDPAAVCLGTREGSDAVALALKCMRGWTSVYTLNPVLPAAVLRALARRAGAHIYNEGDDTLYASQSYLTLAANLAGRRLIRLPRRLDVVDPFTGERLWRGVTEFDREFRAKETVIWRLS